MAAATLATTAVHFGRPMPQGLLTTLDWGSAILGLAGTLASAAIYLVRARPAWNTSHTPLDFVLTGGLLGSLLAAALLHAPGVRLVGAAATLWLGNQAVRALRLRASRLFEARAAFSLLADRRFRMHIVAMIVSLAASVATVALGYPITGLACGLICVLLARYLFFVSVVPLNMALTFVRSGGSA
jgi:formate dehydrogenase iron-sulfur subunit